MPVLTRSQFIKQYCKSRRFTYAALLLCYISAALTAFVAISFKLPVMLIDVALILAPAIFIHVLHSRVCSLILLAYCLYSCITVSLQSGVLVGWVTLVGAILAVIGTFGCDRTWQAYKADPEAWVQAYQQSPKRRGEVPDETEQDENWM